jgi:hypothetical protein
LSTRFATIRSSRRGSLSSVSLSPSTWTRPSQPRRDQRLEIDSLGLQALHAGVEAGDLHQVLDEPPQAVDVGDQQLRGAARLLRHAVDVLGEERRLADQGGERRAQLVRDVGGEAALAGLRRREGLDLRLERRRHLVEGLRPGAELVLPLDREPRLEEALRQRPGGLSGARDRPQHLAREHHSNEGGEDHQDADAREQDVAQLLQLVPQVGLRVEEVELRALPRRPARDEVVGSREGLPLVAELAAPHDPAQLLRNLAQADVRRGHERAPALNQDSSELAPALERLDERFRAVAQVGGSHRQVPPRLQDARVDRVGEEVVPHDEVRPCGERHAREAHRQGKRDREAPAKRHCPASSR